MHLPEAAIESNTGNLSERHVRKPGRQNARYTYPQVELDMAETTGKSWNVLFSA